MAASSTRYGILLELKSKDGKMDELLEMSKEHFNRQLDGREPNATCASILLPTTENPNTVSFWEQWTSKEDYDLHANPPNENLLHFFGIATPLLDGPPSLVECPMEHFELHNTAGTKYGIIVETKIQPKNMDEMMNASRGHFERQLDGREPNATCASILTAVTKTDGGEGEETRQTLRFFEQWEAKTDYDPTHKNSENLKAFFGVAGKLMEETSLKEYHMQHFVKS